MDGARARATIAPVQPIAVIDFETTGLSPTMGDRATEIAIVLLEGDRVVDRFQSLMNAGVRIPRWTLSTSAMSCCWSTSSM